VRYGAVMAILFDTLKLARWREAARMPPRQARETAGALAETITGDLVSREHFDSLCENGRSERI
jgi:hypothetical protein